MPRRTPEYPEQSGVTIMSASGDHRQTGTGRHASFAVHNYLVLYTLDYIPHLSQYQ